MAEVSSPPEYASTTSGPIDPPPVGLCMCVHKNTGPREGVKVSRGEPCRLLQPRLHGAAGAPPPRHDEDNLVARHGGGHLLPPLRLQREGERLRAPRRRPVHEQRAHTAHG